ncbi:MAG TPA: ribosomal-processing cysteine protease Prp [Desulfobacteria bacterium]|nr:ribosomal-processing cysteine protease Prp [Desulfobacteria bacterium]
MKPNTRKAVNRVRITTFLDESQDIRQFIVEGHAGFAAAGEDIVCAAISALTISAVNGLEQFLSVKPVYQVEDGLLKCSLGDLASDEDRLVARSILGTMLLGLKQIHQTYGANYLMFEQRRWTPC